MSYTKRAALATPRVGDVAQGDGDGFEITAVHGYDHSRNRWLVADQFEELHEVQHMPSPYSEGWWDWARRIPYTEYVDGGEGDEAFAATVAAWLDAIPDTTEAAYSYSVFGPDQ